MGKLDTYYRKNSDDLLHFEFDVEGSEEDNGWIKHEHTLPISHREATGTSLQKIRHSHQKSKEANEEGLPLNTNSWYRGHSHAIEDLK